MGSMVLVIHRTILLVSFPLSVVKLDAMAPFTHHHAKPCLDHQLTLRLPVLLDVPAAKAMKRSCPEDVNEESNKSDEENVVPNILLNKKSKFGPSSSILTMDQTQKPYFKATPAKIIKTSVQSHGLQKTLLKRMIPSNKATHLVDRAPVVTGTITKRPALARCVSDPTMPKSWFFEIHEDTEEEYLTNMMDHAATHLEISDDESKKSKKYDNDDKENIPPPGCPVPTRSSAGSRKRAFDDGDDTPTSKKRRVDKLTGERVAMGVLNASDFYPEAVTPEAVDPVEADIVETAVTLFSAKFDSKIMTPVAKRPIRSFTRPSTLQAKLKASSPLQMHFPSIEATLAKSISEPIEAPPSILIEKSDEGIKIWESDHESEAEKEAAVVVPASNITASEESHVALQEQAVFAY